MCLLYVLSNRISFVEVYANFILKAFALAILNPPSAWEPKPTASVRIPSLYEPFECLTSITDGI